MAGRSRKCILRSFVAGLLLLAVGACSNLQLGYNWGDSIALYYLDGYLDLNAEQRQQTAVSLKKLLAWHRQNELPTYSRELIAARQLLRNELTIQQLTAMSAFMRASLERTFLHASPLIADLLLSLSPQQMAHLQVELMLSNAEFRDDYLAGNPDQQSQRRYQRLLEQFESWFGEPSPQQLAVLRVANSDWPVDEQFWYAERLIRQQEMLALVEYAVMQKPSHAEMTERLQQYILGFERDREPARQARILGSREHVMRLIVSVIQRSSLEQRVQAMAHAQQLIDDFGVLVSQR